MVPDTHQQPRVLLLLQPVVDPRREPQIELLQKEEVNQFAPKVVPLAWELLPKRPQLLTPPDDRDLVPDPLEAPHPLPPLRPELLELRPLTTRPPVEQPLERPLDQPPQPIDAHAHQPPLHRVTPEPDPHLLKKMEEVPLRPKPPQPLDGVLLPRLQLAQRQP